MTPVDTSFNKNIEHIGKEVFNGIFIFHRTELNSENLNSGQESLFG